jgi:hypothetical protein
MDYPLDHRTDFVPHPGFAFLVDTRAARRPAANESSTALASSATTTSASESGLSTNSSSGTVLPPPSDESGTVPLPLPLRSTELIDADAYEAAIRSQLEDAIGARRYIDAYSKIVMVDLTVYNPNVKLLCWVRLTFEVAGIEWDRVGSSGTWRHTSGLPF